MERPEPQKLTLQGPDIYVGEACLLFVVVNGHEWLPLSQSYSNLHSCSSRLGIVGRFWVVASEMNDRTILSKIFDLSF